MKEHATSLTLFMRKTTFERIIFGFRFACGRGVVHTTTSQSHGTRRGRFDHESVYEGYGWLTLTKLTNPSGGIGELAASVLTTA